ncbi:precorrin-2 C(20)-methyltransferase [Methanobrevibacter filiformis]|uniref:Cobalt-precorrin-2 C(20)-methyltransferase n=1 Tax=Methanobrevibacter filiformis TaxID=55758 RepID=A0A166C7R7_9EURY|nr:precorrin-2 C(20)-methyltransferase [Methanobrevibacter filiformis]KZX11997.1 cobalt-precorrin-2 C(20)-methyltransferase [Methanobrevibacter filiformis]
MNKKTGKLYGIGVGPGNTELLTIKANKILNNIPVICSPKSSAKRESIALSIVKPLIENKIAKSEIEIIEPVFPMTEDNDELEKHWKLAADLIAKKLDGGYDVGFITLGDPSIFSTFSYIQKKLEHRYEIEMVPGITSFTACASSIGKPLVEKDEVLVIVPKIDDRFENLLDNGNSIVLMKASRNTRELEEKVLKHDKEEIISVENATQKDEKIIKGFSTDKPYLTTTIIKSSEK